MGGKSSSLVHSFASPITNYFYGHDGGGKDGDGGDDTDSQCVPVGRMKVNPFVHTRKSSEFYDEDGHLAHEFYIEIPGSKRRKMKAGMMRIYTNLRPQGEVTLDPPRLRPELPVILCQV